MEYESEGVCFTESQEEEFLNRNKAPLKRELSIAFTYLSKDLMNGFRSADNLLLRKAYSMKVST